MDSSSNLLKFRFDASPLMCPLREEEREVFGCLGWLQRKGDGARRWRLLICAAMPDCSSHVSCAAHNSGEIWANRAAGGDTTCGRTLLTRRDFKRVWRNGLTTSARCRRLRGHALDENNNIVTAHREHQGKLLPHVTVLIFVIFYYQFVSLLFARSAWIIQVVCRWLQLVWHLPLAWHLPHACPRKTVR